MDEKRVAEGAVEISPQGAVIAGQPGSWTLILTAGDGGLPPGSAVRVIVPDGFSPPQICNPAAPGYVRVEASYAATTAVVAIDPLPGLTAADGRGGTGRGGLQILLEGQPAKPGEQIRLVYGAGPGKAFASPYAGRAAFEVLIRTRPNAEAFLPVDAFPALSVEAGPIARVEAVAASGAQPGQKTTMRVIARDASGNRCRGWTGWLETSTSEEGVHPPPTQRVEDRTGDGILLPVNVLKASRVPFRLKVTERESACVAWTNPIVSEGPAPLWGDLHACVEDESPSRAELDFELAVGTRPSVDNESFSFDTGPSEGAGDAPVLRCSLPDRGSDAMLSTHLLEVYSSWGCRERWAGFRPDIRYDRSEDRTAQAVLASGVVAGFGAGSNSLLGTGGDATAAEPGRGYRGGLTAVFAESMSETAIFKALRERRCYATTGHRPLLEFLASGNPMGSLVTVEAGDRGTLRRRDLSVRVHGTAAISRVEIVRNNLEVCTYRGEGLDVAFTWADEHDLTRIALPRTVRGRAASAYYYIRVTQEDGEMAWSSPVWFVLG